MTKNQISHLRQHNRLTGENNKYFIVYISEFQTKTCWRDPHTHFQCLTDSWFMVIVVLNSLPMVSAGSILPSYVNYVNSSSLMHRDSFEDIHYQRNDAYHHYFYAISRPLVHILYNDKHRL